MQLNRNFRKSLATFPINVCYGLPMRKDDICMYGTGNVFCDKK